jgi:hypothetical protein
MAGRIQRDVSSAFGAVAVDVSGGNQTLAGGCRGLYVGVSGNIKVDLPNATGITFSNVPVGIFPVQAIKVYQTGTTATGVVALY